MRWNPSRGGTIAAHQAVRLIVRRDLMMIIQLNAEEQAAQCVGLTLSQRRRATILLAEVEESHREVVSQYIDTLESVREFLIPLFDVLVDRDWLGILGALAVFDELVQRLNTTFMVIDPAQISRAWTQDLLRNKHVDLTTALEELPELLLQKASQHFDRSRHPHRFLH